MLPPAGHKGKLIMGQEQTGSGTIRAFIAAGVSDRVREEIGGLLIDLKKGDSGVKWVRPAAMHLTLRFLGNITEEQVELADRAMAEAVEGAGPVDVKVGGWGTFPPGKRPRVIWLGLEKGASELTDIFEKLEPALASRGFPPADKKFSAHLTLGRVKSGRGLSRILDVVESRAGAGFGEFRVDRITLFQSRLHPDGAIYTSLKERELKGF
jgi:2'-5' RNA ligase